MICWVVLPTLGVAHQSYVMFAPGIVSGMERGPQRVVSDAIVAMMRFVLSVVAGCGKVGLWYGP